MLTGLGFFGPAFFPNAEPVEYTVKVHIEEMKVMPCHFQRSMKFVLKVSRGETIFHVNFPDPVNILPYVWYAIRFQLEVKYETSSKMSVTSYFFINARFTCSFFIRSEMQSFLLYRDRKLYEE